MEFLNDKDLASKTDKEIEDYIRKLINEGTRLKQVYNRPSSKFWKRINDYRQGKDADVEHPKRKEVYTYEYGTVKRKPKKDTQTSSSKEEIDTSLKKNKPVKKKTVIEFDSEEE